MHAFIANVDVRTNNANLKMYSKITHMIKSLCTYMYIIIIYDLQSHSQHLPSKRIFRLISYAALDGRRAISNSYIKPMWTLNIYGLRRLFIRIASVASVSFSFHTLHRVCCLEWSGNGITYRIVVCDWICHKQSLHRTLLSSGVLSNFSRSKGWCRDTMCTSFPSHNYFCARPISLTHSHTPTPFQNQFRHRHSGWFLSLRHHTTEPEYCHIMCMLRVTRHNQVMLD